VRSITPCGGQTYFYQRDGKGLTLTELRQLALDLRKHDKEYQQLYSQVVQQIADRFYEARERFFKGLARFPKEKKPHRYYSLVYPQGGWKILEVRVVSYPAFEGGVSCFIAPPCP
jgi:putative transposase